MKRSVASILISITLAFAWACGGDSEANQNAVIANKIEKALAASPTKGLLVGLETRAFEAWKNKDYAFWDAHLDETYVSYADGRRLDKSGEIKHLRAMKCEVATFSFADEKMTPIGNDAVVLTAKATVDGKCSGQRIPSPSITSTLFVRSGETWRAACHNEVPITDPKTAKSAPTQKTDVRKALLTDEAVALTDALLAIEKKGWDAWKARDAAQLESTFTEDITVVDMFGTVTVGKRDVVKLWTGQKCEIAAAAPVGASGSQVSEVVAILTYKATITGKCDGQPLSGFWRTTIFQKESGDWKAAYVSQTPA